MTNNKYSYETELEAIRLLNAGIPGRQIVKQLGLKSDELIYTWRKYLRNGDYYRLSQSQEKQYKYSKCVAELPEVEHHDGGINKMKQELELESL
ncbi:hypothetical protein [Companilactobacillus keshanensis]|uniref:Transposase n=1 Tax=Companilactobacillus keshanensis TaxID=2486003 RepID=A0ABW4BTC3_9LACO|nr:hypothetical protein [Companilactobacillus keshanensis]